MRRRPISSLLQPGLGGVPALVLRHSWPRWVSRARRRWCSTCGAYVAPMILAAVHHSISRHPTYQVAREMGSLTVAVVTTPFAFEGAIRAAAAQVRPAIGAGSQSLRLSC